MAFRIHLVACAAIHYTKLCDLLSLLYITPSFVTYCDCRLPVQAFHSALRSARLMLELLVASLCLYLAYEREP